MRFNLSSALVPLVLVLGACLESNDVVAPTRHGSNPLATSDGARSKVTLCHKLGNGSYVPIRVSPAAESIHRGHGDAGVGEPVPGSPSTVFDENCLPVAAAVITVTVTPDPASIVVAQQLLMAADISITGATGTPTVQWSSSNAAIATVNTTTGLLTGVAPGSAVIKATATLGSSTASDSATVNVQSTAALIHSPGWSFSTRTPWGTG